MYDSDLCLGLIRQVGAFYSGGERLPRFWDTDLRLLDTAYRLTGRTAVAQVTDIMYQTPPPEAIARLHQELTVARGLAVASRLMASGHIGPVYRLDENGIFRDQPGLALYRQTEFDNVAPHYQRGRNTK